MDFSRINFNSASSTLKFPFQVEIEPKRKAPKARESTDIQVKLPFGACKPSLNQLDLTLFSMLSYQRPRTQPTLPAGAVRKASSERQKARPDRQGVRPSIGRIKGVLP